MSSSKSRKASREPRDIVLGLASFQPIPEILCQEPFTRIFRTHHAWNWFLRQHRDELVKDGALVTLSGRDHGNAPVLERSILKIGRRAAAARCES